MDYISNINAKSPVLSQPSQWPLTEGAVRYITPEFMLGSLRDNRLSRACYPTAVGYYPRAKGHQMARSTHDDNLLIYCNEGSGYVKTQVFSGPVKPGDLLLLPKARAHEYLSNPSDPWTIYWLHFAGLETQTLIRSLDYKPEQPIIQIGQQPMLLGDFKRLLGLRKSGYQHAVFIYAASITRQILCQLALNIRNLTAVSRHNFNLDEIQGLMMEHIESDLDLGTLANCAHLSKFHFANKYKQLTGYPPIKHFIHMKMEHACYLLDNTSAPIGIIASQIGYEDPLYFSRIFRKTVGTSPSEYRKQRT